jgi:prepilin-type N-terminal cleavage/methylation domain-containing protein
MPMEAWMTTHFRQIARRPERTSERRGFTLIELLVVIAIISLLVSILLPSLNKAKRAAQVVVCSSNLHSIGAGLLIYASEGEQKYPAPCSISVSIIYTREAGMSQYDCRDALVEIAGGHGGGKDMYFCPLYQYLRPEDSR